MTENRSVELDKRLRTAFREESAERLQQMATALLTLEKSPSPETVGALTEQLHRNAHSIKGGARLLNLGYVEKLSHAMEGCFLKTAGDGDGFPACLCDSMHQAVQVLTEECAGALVGQPKPSVRVRFEDLTHHLEGCVAQAGERGAHRSTEPPASVQPVESPQTDVKMREDGVETIRVSAKKLDGLLYHTEELMGSKLQASYLAGELDGLYRTAVQAKRNVAVALGELRTGQRRHAVARSDGLNNERLTVTLDRVGEALDRSREACQMIEDRLHAMGDVAGQGARALSATIDSIVGEAKDILLAPVRSAVEPLPVLVRELARAGGKEIAMTVEGEDIELDRRVLDTLRTPFIHLIRNCVDHGIESPEERKRAGKEATGNVLLTARTLEGGWAEFTLSDDGRGVDTEALKKIAPQGRGEDADLSENELLDLVFRSGLSTARQVTEVSGRGRGLAIVRDSVERLGGGITVMRGEPCGTLFRMVVPLLLTTFRGVGALVRGQSFIIPLKAVTRVIRAHADELLSVEGRRAVVCEGRTIPLIDAGTLLAMGPIGDERTAMIEAVVVARGGEEVALSVDRVLSIREGLVKDLGPQLPRVRNILGVTMTETGEIAPILHVGDLLKTARLASGAGVDPTRQEPLRRRTRALVVEDSITSRMLLQHILESAEYEVETAVNGADGLRKLKGRPFDIVVSDIEMPNMDGFAMTVAIRSDSALAHLPVVLVTTLESAESREKGMDAGADAYIVKSAFDQGRLLETVGRLCDRGNV